MEMLLLSRVAAMPFFRCEFALADMFVTLIFPFPV